MRKVYEIKDNLITLARENAFDVIAHGCNCFCTMGAGIAPQMAKAFGADKFPLEDEKYRGDYNKLGTIDFKAIRLIHNDKIRFMSNPNMLYVDSFEKNEKVLYVVNAYTQYGFGKNHKGGTEAPIDYVALKLVMQKINHIFKGKHIGLPWIGAGLAGGNWNKIKHIITRELIDCDVTLVEYDNK